MKALTIQQPWASLIVAGAKCHETRSWSTRHRGPLLIHAGARFPEPARLLCRREPFLSALDGRTAAELPLGVVIGSVEIVECVRVEDIVQLDEREERFGDYRPGRWAWLLRHPVALPHFAVRGMPALFDVALPETAQV
ncbi:MAG: ASCH domain-containing protein [Planctomycetia bacterium]|nr:ASCH domain-containing protein [Planctomycetia bacterium]